MSKKAMVDYLKYEASEMGLEIEVPGDGPITSEIVLIGEGPGENEVKRGMPFVGGSGTELWNTCRRYDIHRHHVYTTNVVKRQISLSSKGNAKHAVGRPELQKWIVLLHEELARLPNVKTVVCMGNMALEAVLDKHGIKEYRGSVYLDQCLPDGREVNVVCTFNPAYISREPVYGPIFYSDIQKLRRVIDGKFKQFEVECLINPSFKDAKDYIREMMNGTSDVSLDIETIANETACVGIGNSATEAMCINLRDRSSNVYSVSEEIELCKLIYKLGLKKPVIAQNGAFDAGWLGFKDLMPIKIGFDTMLAHHTLYPQLPHNLGFIVTQYTTHPHYKSEKDNWREGGDIDSFWRYNCKDVAHTWEVAQYLKRDLEKQGLSDFFHNHVMRLQPHLIDMTISGVAADMQKKAELKEKITEELADAKAKFSRLVKTCTGLNDYVVNPGSPMQLKDLFFNKLKLVGRGKSTDKANRDKMLANPKTSEQCKEMLLALTAVKTEDKFLSTYIESQPDSDNRMRCSWNQSGVAKAPGRLSSSQTLWGSGMNLQNQPRRAYEMFIADEDTVFIYFDLRQAEAQVVAHYYNIDKWKEDFERSRIDSSYDCHRALAADMFKIPYEDTPTEDYLPDGSISIRYKSKRCRHGLNYRMQPFKLAEVAKLSLMDARRSYQLYHRITPELQRGWRIEERKVRQTKQLFNAYGRRWKVLQRIDDKALESIIAFYPQSSIGDKVGRVIYKAHEDDKWPSRARIRMYIHDALIGVAHPDDAKRALSIMIKHAEEPMDIIDITGKTRSRLIIPADGKISVAGEDGVHRWSTLKTAQL